MDEQRLRERLTGLANEIPPVGSAPPGLIPKARRRAYVMPALALLCVAREERGFAISDATDEPRGGVDVGPILHR